MVEASRAVERLAKSIEALWPSVRDFAFLGQLCNREDPVAIESLSRLVRLPVEELRANGARDPDDGDLMAEWLCGEGLRLPLPADPATERPNAPELARLTPGLIDDFLAAFRDCPDWPPEATGKTVENGGVVRESHQALVIAIAERWYQQIEQLADRSAGPKFQCSDLRCPWPQVAAALRSRVNQDFQPAILVVGVRRAAVDPEPPASAKPEWNDAEGKLYFCGEVVRDFSRKRAKSRAEIILCSFEEDGWPRRIDNPLPPDVDLGKTCDTIRNGLTVLSIERDGSGEGVRWTVIGDG